MPSLDIAELHSSFCNHLGAPRAHILFHGKTPSKFAFGKNDGLAAPWKESIFIQRKTNYIPKRLEKQTMQPVRAIATIEQKSFIQIEDRAMHEPNILLVSDSDAQTLHNTSSEDTHGMDDRERLRRMRISKANKGNVPWNKGRKHSAETLQRIRERTKMAMQDPKVKMKLVNLGHPQTDETRVKISVGVREGWQRRRERLKLQETCYFEWQNILAEASKRGFAGEDELQWNSYEMLDEQLNKEWIESVEQRKSSPRPKGSKRAPKSIEQRRKISEAISAKWADPDYRGRVCSALSKYHGTPVGVERKQRRKPAGETPYVKKNPVKKNDTVSNKIIRTETKNKNARKGNSKRKKNSAPTYKDPLADSKLEMIKNMRAQRAAMETKKRTATERAKLLIAEAEKAAKVLEVAALKSPLAQASLLETRKLIAEATRSIEIIENGQITSGVSGRGTYLESDRLENQVNGELDVANPIKFSGKQINGTHSPSLNRNDMGDFNFDRYTLQNVLNGRESPLAIAHSENSTERIDGLVSKELLNEAPVATSNLNGSVRHGSNMEVSAVNEAGNSAPSVRKKKWVCGRLVEVEEN